MKDSPSRAFFTDSETARALGGVGLGGGEHDDKECEEKRDEVGVGNQPALMIRIQIAVFCAWMPLQLLALGRRGLRRRWFVASLIFDARSMRLSCVALIGFQLVANQLGVHALPRWRPLLRV